MPPGGTKGPFFHRASSMMRGSQKLRKVERQRDNNHAKHLEEAAIDDGHSGFLIIAIILALVAALAGAIAMPRIRVWFSTTGNNRSYASILLLALVVTGSVLRTQAFVKQHAGTKGAATIIASKNKYSHFTSSIESSSRKAAANSDQDDTTTSGFSNDLVESLDILPLMEAVSLHAGTRRGRQAFLALAGANYEEMPPESLSKIGKLETIMSARSRRASGDINGFTKKQHESNKFTNSQKESSRKFSIAVAKIEKEAKQEYALVAEALLLLKEGGNSSYPPLYGSSSSPWDTENVAETDYDSFLRTSVHESTLEHIIHAEKIIETVRNVKEWGEGEIVRAEAPRLAEMAAEIDYSALAPLYKEITGTVIIKRVRTLTDPSGRSSFRFELNADKFHVVQVLRTQVDEMAEKVKGKGGKGRQELEETLSALVEKLEATEDEIQSAIFQSVLGRSKEIDTCLDIIARLDVIFSKAAFGESTGGLIPLIENEGKIEVQQFVHPVLLLSENRNDRSDIVAIDLRLSTEDKHRALIISGPNGGG